MAFDDGNGLGSEFPKPHGQRGPRYSRATVSQQDAVLEALQAGQVVDRDFCLFHGLPGCGQIRRLAPHIFVLRCEGFRILTDYDRAGKACKYKIDTSPEPTPH